MRKIINIAGRAATGRSRPFLCDSDDGKSWFVKRDNLDWDSLVREFVISRLGEEYGLPVAPVSLLEIPSILAKQVVLKNAHEFQPGIAFGSQRVPFADDLRDSHLRLISDEDKIRCLCFDWWTRNDDRKLDILGGDPNLLWDPVMQSLVVIDHDRTLDPDFDDANFFREHAFKNVRPFIERDHLEKLRTSFESAIYSLDKIWAEIPEEWLKNEIGDSRISYTLHDIEAILIKPELPVDAPLPG